MKTGGEMGGRGNILLCEDALVPTRDAVSFSICAIPVVDESDTSFSSKLHRAD